jgi:hypothetical protein
MNGTATFSFQSTTIVNPLGVPEGGATLALLALALGGIGLLRRHLV